MSITKPPSNRLAPSLKELLISQNLLDETGYNACIIAAKQLNQPLEDYIYKSGLVPHQILQKAFATSKSKNLVFIDKLKTDTTIIYDQQFILEHGYDLISGYSAQNVIYPQAEPQQYSGFSDIEYNNFDDSILISARDFRHLFINKNRPQMNDQAANLLGNHHKRLTAKHGLYAKQKLTILGVILTTILSIIYNPVIGIYYLFFVFSSLFLLASIIKIFSLFIGTKPDIDINDNAHTLNPDNLPIYSILVPLYKEANMLNRLCNNLKNLNYPNSKLDIKLLFEEDDFETISAAQALNLPEYFEFIFVPKSLPQTKPKAMNFVLPFVKGKFITIYDAEDRPEPDQLLKAVAKFGSESDDLVCLQACLEFENWQENWLAKHFFIEYATQFNRFLPALETLKIPMPLGGTSNHFKTNILRELHGWDAYNVTEDADLGIRLALFGYRSATLDSVTFEEANHRLIPWLNQRTRWQKGWLQTIIVHSRHPTELYAKLGFFRYIGFIIIMLNMIFSSLMHPIILFIPFLLYYHTDLSIISNSYLHMIIFSISMLSIFLGYGAALVANVQAIAIFERWSLLRTLLTAPIYWLLISISAWSAIVDYLRRPFYWSKTEHGVSKHISRNALNKL